MEMEKEKNKPRELLETALDLYEQGFHIFPLGDKFSTPPRHIIERFGDEVTARKHWPKQPRVSWKQYQREAADAEQVMEWWRKWPYANIGIVTGIDLVVVDADDQAASDFMQTSGKISRTPWRVRTSRGMHFYFQANNAIAIKNSASEAKLDIRGIGGYVVGPGSVYADGAVSTWEVDTEYGATAVMDLPMITHDDIQAVHAYTATGGQATGSQHNIFGMSLADVKTPATGEPVGEGGRNNAAASLAGQQIKQGASLVEIKAALDEWNNNNPAPLTDGELNTTIASVARTHVANHPGETIPTVPDPLLHKPITLYSAAQLQDAPPKEPEFFWKGAALFRGARMMIAGGPKAGKSDLFLSMAIAAAHGGEFMGESFTRPLRVVWVQAEIHEAFLNKRLTRLSKGLTDEENAHVRTNLYMTGRLHKDITNAYDRKQITEMIREIQPDIIAVDPVINFSTANENDNVEVHKLLTALDAVGEAVNAAVIAIHHINKSKVEGDPFLAIRGASAFRGWYDTCLLLERNDGTITIAYELRNSEPIPSHILTFNEDEGTYEAAFMAIKSPGESAPDHDDPRVIALVKLINDAPDGITQAKLEARGAGLLRVSPRTAERLVKTLKTYPGVSVKREGRTNRFTYNAMDQGVN